MVGDGLHETSDSEILHTISNLGLPDSEGSGREAGDVEEAIPTLQRSESSANYDLCIANPANSNTSIHVNTSSKDLERSLMLPITMPVENDSDIGVLIRGILVGIYDTVRMRETVLQSIFETLYIITTSVFVHRDLH